MKLTLTDTKSGYNLTPINANFEALEQELQDKVLYRDNPSGEPNQMENSLDMNSNDVLNVNNLSVTSFKINGEDNTQFLNDSVVEAYNWAQHAEDLPVPEGDGTEFSAYHYSLKAEDSATDAETAETAAELALYNFNGTWYGALASDPVQDPNGDPITEGDIYLNTTDDVVKFYSGGMWNPLGGGNVTSAFGRTGAVVGQAGDYNAPQIDFDNSTTGFTSTNVQAAIDEFHGDLASEISDGSFNPASPDEEWSGSQNDVLMSELTNGGSGFYLVAFSGAGTGILSIYVDTSLSSTTQNGSSEITASGGTFAAVSVEFNTSSTFRVFNDSISGEVTNRSQLPITNIYKV